jgi:predicted DNA-binding transcriptional regulator AlpA
MPASRALPPNLVPRGISRTEAAVYIGVGATLFDRLVKDGMMPKPKAISGRKVWDVRALDQAFTALPGGDDAEGGNPWDASP